MTESRANEIFRSKYPEGEICRKHSTSAESKYWVTFEPNGKVYYYSCTYRYLFRFCYIYNSVFFNVCIILAEIH